MSSANKLYKSSGSELPFKEWLRREQLKGKLDVHHDKFLNSVLGIVAGMLISKYVFNK